MWHPDISVDNMSVSSRVEPSRDTLKTKHSDQQLDPPPSFVLSRVPDYHGGYCNTLTKGNNLTPQSISELQLQKVRNHCFRVLIDLKKKAE